MRLFPSAFGSQFLKEFVAVAVLLNDEVEVFVASAGEVDENGTGDTGPGDTDSLGQGVRALDRGDDSLVS